jgi:hypothetical protein
VSHNTVADDFADADKKADGSVCNDASRPWNSPQQNYFIEQISRYFWKKNEMREGAVWRKGENSYKNDDGDGGSVFVSRGGSVWISVEGQ